MRRVVNILWTGGFDSTYRMLELSRMNVIVQPYYIKDSTRKSSIYEIRAMDKIMKWLVNNPLTVAEINPIQVVDCNGVKPDDEIFEAYNNLFNKYKLGTQYEFLARFAKQAGLKLEVGLECSPRSKAFTTLNCEAKLMIFKEDDYSVYVLDKEKSSKDIVLLFENILVPTTLFHMSKLDELAAYKAKGAEVLVKMTHFCHNPTWGGYPCGQCNPCKDALNEGMEFRVPIIGRILGFMRKAFYYIGHKIKNIDR